MGGQPLIPSDNGGCSVGDMVEHFSRVQWLDRNITEYRPAASPIKTNNLATDLIRNEEQIRKNDGVQ